MDFFDLFVRYGIVLFFVLLFMGGKTQISDIVFTLTVFTVFSSMFRNLSRNIPKWHGDWTKAKQSWADLIVEPTVVDKSNAPALKISHGAVDIENVSFAYGKNSAGVLKNLTLKIRGGEHVGIVGLSGSGKTTLVNLLLRLWDVNSGSIKIDGQDIRDVNQGSLRRHISFAPQDSSLFNRSFAENIKYGASRATRAQIIAAAKLAQIHDFIMEHKDGYKTIIGNRGVKLSGGQRQRVAMARAILQKSQILILDEPTSALDSETESKFQNAMSAIISGKTALVIAHRLSTLSKMARIIVIDKGRIAEQGTHAQLLKSGGIYARLWKMQSRASV
jgi:ABC-type multidrug transport system fused ATPase/permease subunit